MTTLVVLTVIVIVLTSWPGWRSYLFWAGSLLNRVAANLESFGTAAEILGHAKLICPGVEHINRTGGVVAGALPLLYGMAEEIVTDVTPAAEPPETPEVGRPASGRRRSRLLDSVGFASDR
jgi:hypothetical protein